MWGFMGLPSPDDDETLSEEDVVIWEEEPLHPFVLPSAWSTHWERQQKTFLRMSQELYKQNVEANRRIMLACLESMKIPYV